MDLELCPNCTKPVPLCVCASLRPQKIVRQVLVLQHPQESREPLSTTPLIPLIFPGARVRVGLSVPNLAKALQSGTPPTAVVDPKRWGVLYLGTGQLKSEPKSPGLYVVTPKKQMLPWDPEKAELDGIVVIDGTWSQSKALWWRNAWLLKLKRLVLVPKAQAVYHSIRKEPSRTAVSSLEALTHTLAALGEPISVEETLEPLRSLAARFQEFKKQSAKS